MDEGLYESVLTQRLRDQIALLPELAPEIAGVDDGDQAVVLTQWVSAAISSSLTSLRKPQQRIDLVERLLGVLTDDPAQIGPQVEQLLALRRPATPGLAPVSYLRPRTPLSDAALLTNAPDEPSLGSEVRAELTSADRVDLLCAFVKWHGVRLLEAPLSDLDARGVPFRVVTTTYMGATERRALDRLVRDFGAEVRIQYDALRTRLHAKAWLFERRTGFDTAYVGSSNLSRAALLDGVEWNVRLSAVSTGPLLEKFRATFETYWNDSFFETYDPDRDRDRLDDALRAARGGPVDGDRVTISLAGLEVRPYSYQVEMLDALAGEREVHDRHRNLLVAATGTGKTVVAALDYRSMVEAQQGQYPSLLFVAHRREILEQSLRTYREVLADAGFGETYHSGTRPERWQHVFASIQSLTTYGIETIPADAFDVVVIDEFHHAQASTYRRLLGHLQPSELLGLTATPERADSLDVREFFGGRTAVELRLWDALGADLLCPFHYFAVADGTDLSSLTWRRGRYDERELENLFTGNDSRARTVLRELRDKVVDVGQMRGLGFCVSVAHAEYMARTFIDAGVPARAVSGTTPPHEREAALADLRHRRVNILFAADLFNEGLDIPEIDTVLFLRPTESATVFLQQLGRGLRRTRAKAVLTVLDFVGFQRKEFRWDKKLQALTGHSRARLARDIETGFPFLPSGCQIVLDRQSQTIVLDNIRSQIANRWKQMVQELRRAGDVDLSTFLEESGVELSDVLRRGSHSWTRLRREAGFSTDPGTAREDQLLKRVRALAHVDDRERAEVYLAVLSDDSTPYAELGEAEQRLARMLFFSLWSNGGGFDSYAAGLEALRQEVATRRDLRSVIDLSFDAARHVSVELDGGLASVPLRIHARYQREEILAAIDYASFDRRPNSFQTGVLYQADLNVDVFFVTLSKSEADYSPTTMYQDYPISPTLFHWESQNATSVESSIGQRYLTGASTVLLFVREVAQDELGTSPYLFLGPATYVEHTGSRPIAITWRLKHPMPQEFFNAASVAAG